jgi:hypothetical protein
VPIEVSNVATGRFGFFSAASAAEAETADTGSNETQSSIAITVDNFTGTPIPSLIF